MYFQLIQKYIGIILKDIVFKLITFRLSLICRWYKSFIKIINKPLEYRIGWLLHMFNFYARQIVANILYKIVDE